MNNLVVAICGDQSLHKNYIPSGSASFDLFVIYYGELRDKYRLDGRFYDRRKGTKFNILSDCMADKPDLFAGYDFVFVPDDDIFITGSDIGRLFAIMQEHRLDLAQPAVLGWTGIMEVAPVPMTKLRFTNYVEIMCPAFSKSALSECSKSFRINKTNWGIDWLWTKLLGNPSDRIAVIDDVVGVHTRPCYFGDTYRNNETGYDLSNKELQAIFMEHEIDGNFQTIGSIPLDRREFGSRPSERKFFPNADAFKHLFQAMRETKREYL